MHEIIHTLRKGETVGDVAVLKLTLFEADEGPTPHREAVMALKELTLTPISMESLRDLPADTFGRAYWEFMERNRLKPFNFSPRIHTLFDRFPVSTRYARIHDMIHVLLGFEPDLEGELGVYAFIYRQNYTRFLNRAYHTGRLFTRCVKPWATARFTRAELRGRQLAEGAIQLIGLRLEDYLPRPLQDVRSELVPRSAQPSVPNGTPIAR